MKPPAAVSGFLKTSSILMAARVGGTGLGFLIQLALVRLMPPVDYGIYVIAMSLAAVLSIGCALGMPSVAARFVVAYQEAGDKARLAGFLRNSLGSIAGMSALIALVAVVIVWSGLIDAPFRVPFILACLIAPVLAAMRFGGALSNAARRFYLTYLPDVTLKPILLVVGLACLYVLAYPLTTSNVLLVHLAVVFAACCVLWVFLRPHRQFDLEGVDPVTDSSAWRRAATPMIFVTLLTSFLADIDILLLSALLPADQVGIFSVCLRIMLLIEFGIQAVFQVTMPDLAKAQARDDSILMKAAIRRAQHMTFCFTLAALCGVYLFGEWLLLLFGEGFVVGANALVFLVAGQVVRSAFGPVTQALTVAGAQMCSLVSYGVALLVLIMGTVLLVPISGLEGAALMLSCAMVLGTLLQAQSLWQKTRLSVVGTFMTMPSVDYPVSNNG